MGTAVKDITFADLHKQMDLLNGYHGYKGKDDNYNKIWGDLDPGLQGASYCAAGDCYEFKHAGRPYVQIDHPWGFSYCPDAVRWAKENKDKNGHSYWQAALDHFEPGDTIFYCWNGTGVAEHTGLMVNLPGNNDVHTFECNTSPMASGDQSNGDGCYYKIRPHDSTVLGVLKSSRWLVDHPDHEPVPHSGKHGTHHDVHNPFGFDRHVLPLVKGDHGPMVKWAQWALAFIGSDIDGVYGPSTEHAVRIWQRNKGLIVDGVIGPQTTVSLSHVTR